MARSSTTPAISAESLVGTALVILQDFGLADLSMRRVAGQLGVQPSALYWHVPDKQSLLAWVCNRLLDGVDAPELTGHWRADVRSRTLALHAALLSTRDAAELTASVLALGTGGHRLRELIFEAAAPAASAPASATAPDPAVLTEATVALLIGDAMITQQRRQAELLGILSTEPASSLPDFSARLDLLLS